MQQRKTYLNWSSGKDAALALYYLQQNMQCSVEYLLTNVDVASQRVSMHGLRVALLQQQLQSIGIASGTIGLPGQPTNQQYEQQLGTKIAQLKAAGFECAAFGDIFLEDLRVYREQQLKQLEMDVVFPLWKKDTKRLMDELIDLGFKAVIVCVNDAVLNKSFVGRTVDKSLLNDLPRGVDPCGENGEFHTFCFDGPVFSFPVRYEVGEVFCKDFQHAGEKSRFWFCDLLPAQV